MSGAVIPLQPAVALTGIGMMTSVGFGAYPTCAAIRAGIVRMRELDMPQGMDWHPDWAPLVGCNLKGLTDGYFGLGRWTRLAADGLHDLTGHARLSAAEFEQTHIFLGLPSPARPGDEPEHSRMLGARIAQWLRLPGLQDRLHVCAEGHAAALKLLREAVTRILQGRLTQAVIGGIDSLVEPETLLRLHEKGRLKTDANPVGLVPGEGSAFFLIESATEARRRKAQVLAWLEAPRVAHEPVSPTSGLPCDGRGLGDAITATFAELSDRGAHTGLLISDLNGEVYRAEEFAKMVPHALRHLRHPWRLWHPADCIGDTGAASSAISVCVGARALSRGYAQADHVLICASSDEGLRGSVYLRSAPKGGERPWAPR